MIKRKCVSFSIDGELQKKFEEYVLSEKYKTKSKAITDIIRNEIVRKEYIEGKEVVGVITIVYDHHKKDLQDKITDVQHEHHYMILSTLHIHLDESNCLEVIVVRGKGKEIDGLRGNLKSINGVKHCSMNITTKGKDV